jgi:ABC-type sugar transport system ATPase subunit
MSGVTLEGIRKHFGEVHALDDVGFDVPDGAFFVLVGPSGAGKTTTLRVTAGLENPDAGNVRFDGISAEQVSPAARDVAMVFQEYALYPRHTVYKNLASPLKARKTPEDEMDRRIREAAGLLRIEKLLDRKPAQLSGGEQQRVALGRALVREPRAFLMDEPLTNLDLQLRAAMRTELTRLHRQVGRTFVYVTNDHVEAMSMADRLAVLSAGRIQQVGTPSEIYSQPTNRFVAGFIGSPRINLLPCEYRDGEFVGESGWRLPVPPWLSVPEGRHLELGVRAEDLTPGAGTDEPGLDGEVYAVEPLGDRSLVDVDVGGPLVKVKADPKVNFTLGERIRVGVAVDHCHVFDAETGEAVEGDESGYAAATHKGMDAGALPR